MENELNSMKKYIINNVDNLNINQKEEIINIIRDLNYMTNNNGIFISLNHVDENRIKNMYDHIQYCKQKGPEKKSDVQIVNLQYVKEFLNKQKEKIVESPIIEKHIKKMIIPKKECKVKNIIFSPVEKEIIQFSKCLK